MWYAKSPARKSETPAEKKRREAGGTLKWVPYISAVVLIVVVCECIALAEHPDMEHLLNLVNSVGFVLYFLSHWKKADATLTGKHNLWPFGMQILSLLLIVSTPSLRNMWHHRETFLFYAFGGAVLVLVLFLAALIVMEVTSERRTDPRK